MQSGDFYARVISTNYPQAAGSHGPHRPSACITTYPHPRQPFSVVLRVADGPNLRDPTALVCNLPSSMERGHVHCRTGQSRRDEAKGVSGDERRTERSRKPVLFHPSCVPAGHPSLYRAGSKVTPGVASPRARGEGKGRREKRAEREKKKN